MAGSRVVLAVEVTCYLCRMVIPSGTLAYFDGKRHRHINCGTVSKYSHESRNFPRRKAYIRDTFIG